MKYFFLRLRLIFISVSLASCVTNDNFKLPKVVCNEPNMIVTHTLNDIFGIATDELQQFTEDIIIEAYVISDDAASNFFKSIVIQSKDTKIGVLIKLDGYNLSTSYEVGRKIYILLKGLFYQKQHSQLVIGSNSSGRLSVISQALRQNHIVRSCEFLEEKDLVRKIEVKDISDLDLNTLIEIEGIQFENSSIGRQLYDKQSDIGSATNHLIEDKYGYNLLVRTSKYSSLGDITISPSHGKIRGVLSKYNSDYQLFLRFESDLVLEAARFNLQKISIDALSKKVQDVVFSENRYVEGVVTISGYANSRNSRNIAENLCILQDDTAAIALYFDADLHEILEGDTARIYIKGYNIDTFGGQLRLEQLDFNGRSPMGLNHIEILSSNNPIPNPKKVSLQDLIQNKHPLELVTVPDIQFSGEYRGLTLRGTKVITDCRDNLKITTRSEALFSRENVTNGRGHITGICSGAKTFILKSISGISAMTNPRCDQTTLIFSEDFENMIIDDTKAINLSDWYQVRQTSGQTLWKAGNFGGNQYVQISAFKTDESVQTWLVTPRISLDDSVDEYLRFKSKDGYYNGEALEVFISKDFNGDNFLEAKWIKVPAKVSSKTYSEYASVFTDSGKIDLSSYEGQISIGFKYMGNSSGITTTIQLDDIEIYAKLK